MSLQVRFAKSAIGLHLCITWTSGMTMEILFHSILRIEIYPNYTVDPISASCTIVFFYLSHCLSVVGLEPSSSLSTGCVVSLRGDWAIFCHAGSGRVGRVWSLEILRHGWELNLSHREDRQWDTFILSLSYLDPGHWENRQWDTFILPLSYHDPGPWAGQTVRYIHPPTELSRPGPRRGQTVRYIHSPTELSWPGPWAGQTWLTIGIGVLGSSVPV